MMYFRQNAKEIKVKDRLSQNNEENKGDTPEISSQREKIVNDALAELRKVQGKMNPKFLKKIRDLVKNSPALIEKLGLKKSEIPQSKAQVAKPPVKHEKPSGYEKIDQAKNMDVVSKLLELNPDKKEMIKKLLSQKRD